MPVNDTPPPPIRQQPSCAPCKYREFDWQTWRSRCTLGPGRPIEGDENRLVCDEYQPEREIDPPAPATIDPAIAALRAQLAEALAARDRASAALDAERRELAAADHAATERACAIVCPMCANIDWMPAYKSEAGAWLHQSGHPGRSAVICVAAGIREAARVTSEIVKMLDETNSPAASAIREAATQAKGGDA